MFRFVRSYSAASLASVACKGYVPLGATATPANKRYGRAFQRPHQRVAAANPLRRQCRFTNHIDELFAAVKPSNFAACSRGKNVHLRSQGMTEETSRIIPSTRLRSNRTRQLRDNAELIALTFTDRCQLGRSDLTDDSLKLPEHP